MCLSCGCGSPNDQHGDQRNITWQDIDAAARAAGTTRDKVVQNIMDGVQRQQPSSGRAGNSGTGGNSSSTQSRSSYSQQSEDYDYGQSRTDFGADADKERDGHDHNIQREGQSYTEAQGGCPMRRDGYGETRGAGYGQSGAHNAQDQPQNPAQQGYDPRHSGVRHARNEPGEPVDEPGRETGTAWGKQLQMGRTTDTPDRRNPAN